MVNLIRKTEGTERLSWMKRGVWAFLMRRALLQVFKAHTERRA